MSQIPLQTWQREPFRQTIAPVSNRVLHSIWPTIQRVREILSIRVKTMAEPLVFPKEFRSNAKAAIIGGVMIWLYCVLLKAGTIAYIMDIPNMIKRAPPGKCDHRAVRLCQKR